MTEPIPPIRITMGRGPFELHRLPNGDTIWYRDSNHSYWTNAVEKGGKWAGVGRLMGCSTFTKHAEHDAGPLMGWAGKRNVAGMSQLIHDTIEATDPDSLPDALAWATDEVEAMRMLRENKLTWADKRDKAGDDGTLVHDAFERLLRGETFPEDSDISEVASKKLDGCEAFIAKHEPEVLNLEQVVYSKKNGYAGRFDARLKVGSEIWLLDLKTSGFIAPGYFVQLAAYELAARECGIGASDRRMILQVSAEGGHRLVESGATDEDVLACLHLHKRGKELKAPRWDGLAA